MIAGEYRGSSCRDCTGAREAPPPAMDGKFCMFLAGRGVTVLCALPDNESQNVETSPAESREDGLFVYCLETLLTSKCPRLSPILPSPILLPFSPVSKQFKSKKKQRSRLFFQCKKFNGHLAGPEVESSRPGWLPFNIPRLFFLLRFSIILHVPEWR